MSGPIESKDHPHANRCQYRDSRGRQCKNTARKGHEYCRPCARKMRESQKSQRVATISKALRNETLTYEAEALMPYRVQRDCFRYLARLGEQVPISQVILYGSYAQRRAHSWSDVDLAVISSGFYRMSFLKRTVLLREVGLAAKTPKIQAIGLTPRELEVGDRPRVVRKVREGVRLFST